MRQYFKIYRFFHKALHVSLSSLIRSLKHVPMRVMVLFCKICTYYIVGTDGLKLTLRPLNKYSMFYMNVCSMN